MMQFCRSRNDGHRCTRELGHRGLHRHRTIMWTDAGADAPRCPGSGMPGAAADSLENGYPDGRALCTMCLAIVTLDASARLVAHDTWSAASDAEAVDRRDWFNTHGLSKEADT
jgi:hypothetical protein